MLIYTCLTTRWLNWIEIAMECWRMPNWIHKSRWCTIYIHHTQPNQIVFHNFKWGCTERFRHHRGLAIPTCITARAWRTCRDACRDRWLAVSFEVGGGEKHSQHSTGMRNPQFYISGRRPMAVLHENMWIIKHTMWHNRPISFKTIRCIRLYLLTTYVRIKPLPSHAPAVRKNLIYLYQSEIVLIWYL